MVGHTSEYDSDTTPMTGSPRTTIANIRSNPREVVGRSCNHIIRPIADSERTSDIYRTTTPEKDS